MSNFTKPVEDLSKNAREYADMKVDEVKLRTAKGLSISLNYLLSMILVLFAASVVMLVLAFGLILLLGQALHSYAVGAFIVAGIFAIITFVLYLLRNKLFLNKLVAMFAGLFFENEKEDEDGQI